MTAGTGHPPHNGQPQLTAEQLEQLAKLADGDRAGAPDRPPKLRRLDVAMMVREPPPPVPWVVDELVVRGALTVVNGREGEGKSLLSAAIAAGVSSGQTEAGLVCHTGKVLIVDAENGKYEIHRRVHALELPPDIAVYEAQGFDLRSDLAELESIIEEHRPHLLVLDAFRSLWGGDENDSAQVAAVLDPLRNLVRRLDAGTLLLHHSGRTTGDYRGSSAIGASCELGFKLARADEDDDPDRRYLEAWKCRPAATPPKRWLRLTVERGRVFIDQAKPPTGQPAETKAPVTAGLMAQLSERLRDEPQTRAELARAVGRDAKDRSVGRALASLVESGEAEKVGPEKRPRYRRWHGGEPLKEGATTPPSPKSLIPRAKTGVAAPLPMETHLPPPPPGAADAERSV